MRTLLLRRLLFGKEYGPPNGTVTASELVFFVPFLLEAVVGLLPVGMGVNCNSVPCWDFARCRY